MEMVSDRNFFIILCQLNQQYYHFLTKAFLYRGETYLWKLVSFGLNDGNDRVVLPSLSDFLQCKLPSHVRN